MNKKNEKRKILIIDDNPIDREVVMDVLNDQGYEVHGMEDARECLTYIEKNNIELVLLDWIMPIMSGMEVLKIIRKNYKMTELPVILLTAKSRPDDILEALENNANDYIQKPLHSKIVDARIATQLRSIDINKESQKIQNIVTVNAMVATYHHEILNPLSIAVGILQRGIPDEKKLNVCLDALNRITNIIKKIGEINSQEGIEFSDYVGNTKIIQLDKSKNMRVVMNKEDPNKYGVYFDINYVNSLKPDLFKKISELFIKQNKNGLEDSITLFNEKKYLEFRIKIHFLNGSAVNMGAKALGQQCSIIEDNIDDEEYDELPNHIEKLKEILENTLTILNSKINI